MIAMIGSFRFCFITPKAAVISSPNNRNVMQSKYRCLDLKTPAFLSAAFFHLGVEKS